MLENCRAYHFFFRTQVTFPMYRSNSPIKKQHVLWSLHGFPRQPGHFFLVNRVENQKEPIRPQKWWPFGFVLVFNSAYGNGGTDYYALGLWDNLRSSSSICPIIQVHYNQCQCLPKAELKTKTNPNGHHFCGRLGSFWFSTRFTRKKVIRLARKTVYGSKN